jgi:para-aminobenzoate synthetase/4-amino-4-deoxychorismate lyase
MRASMTGGVVSATVDDPDPAYGVFDTLLVRGGRAVDLDAHLGRLRRSVLELYAVRVDADELAARVLAEAGGLARARVRTSYEPDAQRWDVEATRIEEPALDPRTLAPRHLARGLGPHKWVDRRLVADPGEGDDVLVVDEDGSVLECGSANVFAVVGGEVVTPPLDGRILPGTVRARVLSRLRERPVTVTERAFGLDELSSAGEVFTTSSIRGVQPVTACLGVGSWPVGATTTWLREALQ